MPREGLERPEKMAEVIARQIVHSIVSRGLQPGHRLPSESAMLEEYGVGRNSLREALRLLEVHGLIRMKPGPGGGPVVAEVRSESFGKMMTLFLEMQSATFNELIDVRIIVEPVLARMAAKERTAADVKRLFQIVDRARSVPAEDVASWTEATTAFHDAVAEMSKNRVLDVIARGLKGIYFDRTRSRAVPTREHCQAVDAAHRDIAQAIADRDAETAASLMCVDIERALARIKATNPNALKEIVNWR